MELAEYLMCVAARHYQAKDDHGWELRERKYEKRGHKRYPLTYQDEAALLKGVISSIRGKPPSLKKLSPPAIAVLAYVLKARVQNYSTIEGHEITDRLIGEPERTVIYLNALGELNDLSWIQIIQEPGQCFTDQPPFCYLKSYIELGPTFHREMGANQKYSNGFASNDAYLDAVYMYLQGLIDSDNDNLKVCDADADLSTLQPIGWFNRITLRVESSTSNLPAAKALEKYSLSIYQYLTLVGLLGTKDGDLSLDFNDPDEVAHLFAKGRACRKRMQDHLFGESSKLIRQKLIEGAHGSFGEEVRLTQLGIKALLGRNSKTLRAKGLKTWVKQNTLFDVEEPKVKKASVRLPSPVMEALQSIIFSESRAGMQIRKRWYDSLPSAWGSPTGTTVLLYGPPGTGKTLTAQYLASELKLPLLKIDAAQILSCWVGESEQNVRRVFTEFEDLQQELGKSPVLLLNEADQLLGARGPGSNSIDRMNNNMQNLFLEGLEKFSGILVATTNRRDLLDEAFSRRFTFKIFLPAPDKAVRIDLWRSHLPMNRLADGVDLSQLAELELTGGEIRLVIDRVVRLLAYRGVMTIDGSTLMDVARNEIASRMKRYGKINSIGFGTASNG